MENEKSHTREEILEAYIESLNDGFLTTLHFIPLGIPANQEALRTISNNIAKEFSARHEENTKNLKSLFFDCPYLATSNTTASPNTLSTIANNIANASQSKHEEFEKLFYDSLDKNSM